MAITTALAWTRNKLDAAQPALNLATQYTTLDGSLGGPVDGVNVTFTPVQGAVVTQMIAFLNGNFLREDVDYTWAGLWTSSGGPWRTSLTMTAAPVAGDVLTILAFGD